MSYYLSNSNEAIILPILEEMRSRFSDFTLESSNPKITIDLIRNAINTRYKDLKNKFRIKQTETKVIFKLKSPIHILQGQVIKEDKISFIKLVQILVMDKPDEIELPELTPEELDRLLLFLNKNNYIILGDKIKKNA